MIFLFVWFCFDVVFLWFFFLPRVFLYRLFAFPFAFEIEEKKMKAFEFGRRTDETQKKKMRGTNRQTDSNTLTFWKRQKQNIIPTKRESRRNPPVKKTTNTNRTKKRKKITMIIMNNEKKKITFKIKKQLTEKIKIKTCRTKMIRFNLWSRADTAPIILFCFCSSFLFWSMVILTNWYIFFNSAYSACYLQIYAEGQWKRDR